MKVYAVTGARKGGNTARLTQQFIKGALSAGHEVICDNLFDSNIHGCAGCQACKANGGACVIKDDIPAMLSKLLAADVVVLASPVYYFSVSAQLKMFLDRCNAVMDSIKDKKVYFITTGHVSPQRFPEGFKKVAAPIEGWLMCLDGVELVSTISAWNMGEIKDITAAPAYAEAEKIGAGISNEVYPLTDGTCSIPERSIT